MTRVIDPILADLQWEDAQAEARGPWRRRFVRARAKVAFWRALTLHVLIRRSRPAAESRSLGVVALVATVVAATVVITAALIAPSVLSLTKWMSAASMSERARMVLYMVPAALAIGIPTGFLIGATTALVGSCRSRRVWSVTVLVAGLCCGASATAFWVAPVANHAFRVLTTNVLAAHGAMVVEPTGPRVPELTWRELGEQIEGFKEFREANLPLKPAERGLWFYYHSRVALYVTPLIFGPLALGLSSFPKTRTRGARLAVLAAVSWYVALSGTQRLAVGHDVMSPVAAAWAPNLAAALVALTLATKPPSTLRAKPPKHPAA